MTGLSDLIIDHPISNKFKAKYFKFSDNPGRTFWNVNVQDNVV